MLTLKKGFSDDRSCLVSSDTNTRISDHPSYAVLGTSSAFSATNPSSISLFIAFTLLVRNGTDMSFEGSDTVNPRSRLHIGVVFTNPATPSSGIRKATFYTL